MPTKFILPTFLISLFIFGSVKAQSDPSFLCLQQEGPTQVVSGVYDSEKFEPQTAPYKKFDARGATFILPGTFSHSMIALEGSGSDTNMCWAGGYITANTNWHPIDASWELSKRGTEASNTTSITSYENQTTFTGLYIYNVHDGIRTNNSYKDWTIQHTWLNYIRDDCVENDHIYPGKIYDVLFDGCYSGISVRPSSDGDGVGTVIDINKMLLRMEPMPYPYKWDEKDDPRVFVEGYGETPFGNGNIFKMDEGNEPQFKIKNSVFLLEYFSDKQLFPPKDKVIECSNNTFIYLGDEQNTPNYLLQDFPGCFTLITNKNEGKQFWGQMASDWHQRHPEVGKNYKPVNTNFYNWPRYGVNANPTPTVTPTINPTTNPTPTPTTKPTLPTEYDLNKDGFVNLGDVIFLIKQLFT